MVSGVLLELSCKRKVEDGIQHSEGFAMQKLLNHKTTGSMNLFLGWEGGVTAIYLLFILIIYQKHSSTITTKRNASMS